MGLNPGLATYYLCGLGQRVCLRLLTCKITVATPTGLCKSRDRMYVNRVEGPTVQAFEVFTITIIMLE